MATQNVAELLVDVLAQAIVQVFTIAEMSSAWFL
jgi:hypothetical protein